MTHNDEDPINNVGREFIANPDSLSPYDYLDLFSKTFGLRKELVVEFIKGKRFVPVPKKERKR